MRPNIMTSRSAPIALGTALSLLACGVRDVSLDPGDAGWAGAAGTTEAPGSGGASTGGKPATTGGVSQGGTPDSNETGGSATGGHDSSGTGGMATGGHDSSGTGGGAAGGRADDAGGEGGEGGEGPVAGSGGKTGGFSGSSTGGETGAHAGAAGSAGSPVPSTCADGDTRLCSEAGLHGACANGTQSCTAEHEWGPCSVSPAAADSCSIEGDDANCDGRANDGCTCTAGSERACQDALGNCADGIEVCNADGLGWGACSIEPEASDLCTAGDDSDCDGTPNEGCDCEDGDEQPCGPNTDWGICEIGAITCTGGSWGDCLDAVYRGPRNCTSTADNNCDDSPDNTLDDVCVCTPGNKQACGEHPEDGVGVCKSGTTTCIASPDGSSSDWSEDCVGSIAAGAEACDAARLDEDCDGTVNESPTCPWYDQVVAGYTSTCARLTTGEVRCWGNNDGGQLGDKSYDQSAVPVTVSGITASVIRGGGGYHYCALTGSATAGAGGTVRCWGMNGGGQLGNQSTTNSPEPVALYGNPTAVGLGIGREHSCMLPTPPTVPGSAQCWGNNFDFQLGVATGPTYSDVPVSVSGTGGGLQIGGGAKHTCILYASDGSVECWGDNDYSQLGDGSITGAEALAVGAYHACVLMADGTVQCWGQNSYGRLGRGGLTGTYAYPDEVTGLTDVVRVAAGGGHTCAVVEGGEVYCWGLNDNGQLGNGDTGTNSGEPVPVAGIDNAVDIACGTLHTCAVLANGSVVCWGDNDYGQLGDATTADRTAPVEIDGMYD